MDAARTVRLSLNAGKFDRAKGTPRVSKNWNLRMKDRNTEYHSLRKHTRRDVILAGAPAFSLTAGSGTEQNRTIPPDSRGVRQIIVVCKTLHLWKAGCFCLPQWQQDRAAGCPQ
jgi:hypothetical protein